MIKQLASSIALAAIVMTGAHATHAADKTKAVKSPTVAEKTISKRVNINTADAKTLAASLRGVGQSKAEAIVEWRSKHGRFKAIEQLAEVKGIGPALIKKNAANITL